MHCRASNRPIVLLRMMLMSFALLLVAAGAAAAEPTGQVLREEQQARLEARIEEALERLALSDEQRVQFEALLRRDFERRVEVLQRHGMTREAEERPDRRVMRAVRSDLQAVREQTDAELERILDDRQLEEYRRIRQEAQEDMRERLRSRSTETQ